MEHVFPCLKIQILYMRLSPNVNLVPFSRTPYEQYCILFSPLYYRKRRLCKLYCMIWLPEVTDWKLATRSGIIMRTVTGGNETFFKISKIDRCIPRCVYNRIIDDIQYCLRYKLPPSMYVLGQKGKYFADGIFKHILFYSLKIFVFWFKLHLSLFQRVQLIIRQLWFN